MHNIKTDYTSYVGVHMGYMGIYQGFDPLFDPCLVFTLYRRFHRCFMQTQHFLMVVTTGQCSMVFTSGECIVMYFVMQTKST